MKTVTATEAARELSHLLSEVRYRGESFLIVRNGEPVASLAAPPGAPKGCSLGELLTELKGVGVDDPDFANDLEQIQGSQPALPRSPWAS